MKERVLMCLVLLALVISQVACGLGSDDIVGYWEYVEPSAGRSIPGSMEFYSNGTVEFWDAGGESTFIWEYIISGNSLRILEDGELSVMFTFSISNDVLTLEDPGGTYEFVRAKRD